MNKDAWYQYFTECEAVTDRNAELVEEKFKECEAYTEQVLKKTCFQTVTMLRADLKY